MSDEERRTLEQRRALEVEARYSAGLTAFLACLRGGHVLSPKVLPFAFRSGVDVGCCVQCGLLIWRDAVQPAPALMVDEVRCESLSATGIRCDRMALHGGDHESVEPGLHTRWTGRLTVSIPMEVREVSVPPPAAPG